MVPDREQAASYLVQWLAQRVGEPGTVVKPFFAEFLAGHQNTRILLQRRARPWVLVDAIEILLLGHALGIKEADGDRCTVLARELVEMTGAYPGPLNTLRAQLKRGMTAPLRLPGSGELMNQVIAIIQSSPSDSS